MVFLLPWLAGIGLLGKDEEPLIELPMGRLDSALLPVDRYVIDMQAALEHHLLQVSVTQWIPQDKAVRGGPPLPRYRVPGPIRQHAAPF